MKVDTHIPDLVTGQHFISNTFQFTFECDLVPVRRVEPELYSEAMEWLEGRRLVVQFQGRQNMRERGGMGAGRDTQRALQNESMRESGDDAVKVPGPTFISDAKAVAD